MSIDDDFYDLQAFVEERSLKPEWDMADTWDRFGTYLRHLEEENEQLAQENFELKSAMRVMLRVKEEVPKKRGPSPYDCSVNRVEGS